jgi:hypothetical protein
MYIHAWSDQASISDSASGSHLRAAEEAAHLGLTIAAVTPEGPQGSQLPGFGPTGDRLGVDPEKGGNLGRGQQCLGFNSATGH